MAKIYLSEIEVYPVYEIISDGAKYEDIYASIELTEDEVAEYIRVMTAFEAWRKKLRPLYFDAYEKLWELNSVKRRMKESPNETQLTEANASESERK